MVSFISGRGHFSLLYKYTRHNIHNREGGRKEKQTPNARKEKFVTLSVVFLWPIASVYQSEIPTQPPGTLTRPLALADLVSKSTVSNSSLGSRLFLNVALPRLLLTAFFHWLPGELPSLVFFRSRWKSRVQALLWVSRQNRQKNSLTGTHPHPHPRKRMHTSCHSYLWWWVEPKSEINEIFKIYV